MRTPSRSARQRLSAPVCGLLGVGAAVLSSTAQVVLTENNSEVYINPTSEAGMYDWLVDSQDYLTQQQLWYRIGSAGPESSIHTLSYLGASQPTLDRAILSYTGVGFDLEIDYTLNAGSIGSGASDVVEHITVLNTSGNPLDFHLFLYSDFNLAGTATGDTVDSVLYFPYGSSPGYTSATQTDGLDEQTTSLGTFANRAEAEAAGVTLGKLNDGAATDLLNGAGDFGPNGPGDMTYAFQWDLSLADDASKTLTVDKRLEVIPEPTTVALGLLGLAALFHASRRRRV